MTTPLKVDSLASALEALEEAQRYVRAVGGYLHKFDRTELNTYDAYYLGVARANLGVTSEAISHFYIALGSMSTAVQPPKKED